MNKITFSDFNKILDGARFFLNSQSAPVCLSNQEVIGRGINNQAMEAHLAVIESTIRYLAVSGLLKEDVAIDYEKKFIESIDT
jgi:hypothetical protein